MVSAKDEDSSDSQSKGREEFTPSKHARRSSMTHLPDVRDMLPSLRDLDDIDVPRERGRLSKPPPGNAIQVPLWMIVLCLITSLVYWGKSPSAQYLAVSHSAIFVHHEWWRIFTALFAHSGPGHLLANSTFFVIFGWLLYGHFGWRFFPLLSIILGAVANVATVYYYPPNVKLIGASGMVHAMVGLWMVLYFRFATRHGVVQRIARCLGFLLMALAPSTFDVDTSYLAHAWGLGLGLAFGFPASFFVPPDKERETSNPPDPPMLH